MKKTMLLLVVVALLSACTTKNESKKEEMPKYWCWITYSPKYNWDEILSKLSETGVTGLLLNAKADEYPRVIPIAKKYGVQVHAWQFIMNTQNMEVVAKNPDWLSVNREGKSLAEQKAYVDYYKFLCPALPEVREFLENQVREILEIDGIEGISLDYIRYVDVILPGNLQPKYGIVQDKEYPEWDYGYHPAMIEKFQALHGYDPRELEDPSQDQTWKQFRYDQITEVVNHLVTVAHEYDKSISASPFPSPSLARKIVRQDWDKWNLDFVFPMVYTGFYSDGGSQWIADQVTEGVAAMDKKDADLFCGLYAPDHKNDTLPLSRAMQIAVDNGAKGIAFFSYHGLDDSQWEQLAAFIKENP